MVGHFKEAVERTEQDGNERELFETEQAQQSSQWDREQQQCSAKIRQVQDGSAPPAMKTSRGK